MKFRQIHLFWILAIILFSITLWRPWQQDKTDTADLWIADFSELEADLTFEGIRYTRNSGDKTQWILEASVVKMFEDREIMDLQSVRIEFFPTGGSNVIITADSGEYKIDSEMSLKGDVEVHSGEDSMLCSNTMHFSEKKGLIWTKDRVLIKNNGLVMKGNGLEYDIRSGKLTVMRQTSVLSENGELEL